MGGQGLNVNGNHPGWHPTHHQTPANPGQQAHGNPGQQTHGNPGQTHAAGQPTEVIESKEGEFCGAGPSPWAHVYYKCQKGLVCHTRNIPGTYGRCQPLFATLGGVCGEGYYPRDCKPGLTCQHPQWDG